MPLHASVSAETQTLVSKCHSARCAYHNERSAQASVVQQHPTDKHPLFVHKAFKQRARSSSHSGRSVFTGLFWSRGRTPPGPQLIGWESCVPVKPSQWWGVCVGGQIIDQDSLVLLWQWPMGGSWTKTLTCTGTHSSSHANPRPCLRVRWARFPSFTPSVTMVARGPQTNTI